VLAERSATCHLGAGVCCKLLVIKKCPRGGIGRRARFRFTFFGVLLPRFSSLHTCTKPLIPLIEMRFHGLFHRPSNARQKGCDSSTKTSTDRKSPVCLTKPFLNPAARSRVVIRLAEERRPSQMPTRERFAPTSAWSCRPCPQDCAPAALATLGPMPPPPGRVSLG
jgi:hypothetical protein